MAEPGGTRRQHAEERREQILNAAIEVFAEKGFAGASIRDIARKVGVTEGLLYHYFDSKEQLIHACWTEKSWRAQMERIIDGSGDEPLETVLRKMVRNFLDTMYDNGPMIRLCATEIHGNSEIAQSFRSRIDENQSRFTAFLEERRALGEIKQGVGINVIGGLLMGTAHSMLLLFSQLPKDEWNAMVDSLVYDGVDIIMNGIRPASNKNNLNLVI